MPWESRSGKSRSPYESTCRDPLRWVDGVVPSISAPLRIIHSRPFGIADSRYANAGAVVLEEAPRGVQPACRLILM